MIMITPAAGRCAKKWIAFVLCALLLILSISANIGYVPVYAETTGASSTQPDIQTPLFMNSPIRNDADVGDSLSASPPHDGWLFRMTPTKGRVMAMQVMLPESARPITHTNGIYHVQQKSDLDDLIHSGMVETIEPNLIVNLIDTPAPNDPKYLAEQSAYMTLIGQPAVWAAGLDGYGTTVAVIDSGIIPVHEDLRGSHILPGVNTSGTGASSDTTDATGHGTFVSGIITAHTNNAIGLAGISDGITLLPLRAFASGSTSLDRILSAMEIAISSQVDVINMSFGMTDNSPLLQQSIQQAANANILMVAAAGNYDPTKNISRTTLMYPAAYPEVIGVGAVDANGVLAGFSMTNSSVFVTAPGKDMASLSYTSPTAYSLSGNGTSYAAPVVTALAALARQTDPAISTAELKALLQNAVLDRGTAGYDTEYGYGIVQADIFLSLLNARTPLRTIKLNTNGGHLPSGIAIPKVFTTAGRSISLPLPTREGYAFEGWYRSIDYTGNAVSIIQPANESTSVELYAKWQPGTTKDLDTISLMGIHATLRTGESTIYDVALPNGTILTELDTEALVIIPTSPQATIDKSSIIRSEISDQWTFTVTGPDDSTLEYTLFVTVSVNSAPTVTSDHENMSAHATPASLDGETEALSFVTDMTDWFSDPDPLTALIYRVSSTNAIGHYIVNGSQFSYQPSAEEANKSVVFKFNAFDGQFKSPDITLTIHVGALPASLPTISSSSGVFDLNPFTGAYADIPIHLTMYGQTLVHVMDKSTTPAIILSTDAYVITDVVENGPVTTATAYLDLSWLSTLPAGDKTLSFVFSDSTQRTYELAILDTFIPVSSVTALPSNMIAGTPLTLSGSVSPANASNKLLSWAITSAGTTGASLSGNTLSASSAGTISMTAIVVGGLRTGDWEAPFVITVNTPTPTPDPGGSGSVAPPPPPPPPPALPPPAPVAPPDEELVLFAANEPVTLTYTQADGVVSLTPSDDSLQKLLERTVTASPLELNLTAIAGSEAVVMPTGMLSTLVAASTPGGINGVRLSLPEGSITLDAAALRGLSSRSTGEPLTVSIQRLQTNTLTASQQALVGTQPVFDLSVALGDMAIHTFTGQISFSLPYTMQPGQTGDGLVVWHLTEDGRLDPVTATYNSVTRRVTFTVPHLSLYAIGYDPLLAWKNPFADVAVSAWYLEAVRYANYHGLFSGTGASSFSPQADMNRAMFVTVLSRMAKKAAPQTALSGAANTVDFLDVPMGQWYSDAVAWAVRAGVAGGVGDNRFAPERPVTREQIAVMLHQYARLQDDIPQPATIPTTYTDTGTISSWARTAMQWAIAEGLITGKSGGRLDPGGKATRAEVAVMLMRYAQR